MLKVIITLAVLGLLWIVCKNVAVKLMLPIAKKQIERYTGSEVDIESIEVQLNGLAKMKGVVVSSCLDTGDQPPLLKAKTILVEFPVSSILRLRPRLRSLTIEDFVLDLRYDNDISSWNLALTGDDGKGKKGAIPALVLRRGTIRLSRVSGGVVEKIISVGVTKGAVADVEKKNGLGFTFDINPSSSGLSGVIGGKLETDKSGKSGKLIITSDNFSTGPETILGNLWNVRKLRLDMDYDADDLMINTLEWEMGEDCKFSLSGKVTDYLDKGSFSGQFYAENMHFNDKTKVNALVYDEGLTKYIGPGFRRFLGLYEPKGICDFKFKANGKLSELRKSKWSGTATCKDVSIQHKKFPYRLEKITGDIILSNNSFTFSDLNCKHDDSVFTIRGGTKPVDGIKVTDIIITSENMLLGKDVFRALKLYKKQHSVWYTFSPEGRARIKYSYLRKHDQIKGRSEIQIDMLGGRASYLHFPYPLENITGRVIIGPQEVTLINLVSGTDESSITLNGKVTDIRSGKPSYDIWINAKNIPLDTRLKMSLPYSQRSFFDSFKMKARTDAKIHVFPNQVGTRPVEYTAEISIKDATMMYENFPLPLTNVNVEAILTPSLTRIIKMTGRNNDGTVEISGKVWPADENYPAPGYCLELDAKNIQIQDRWLKTLPADSYKVLSKLHPKGAINVKADLSVNPRIKCSDFKIDVESLGGSINYTKFPYPIENIFGKVTIEKDKITLENMRSISQSATDADEHAKSITVDGTILTGNHKVKSCDFSVSAKNIAFDDKLKKALEGYSTGLDKDLSPSGRFDLAIERITYQNDGDNEGIVDFISDLTLKEFVLKDKGILGEINGSLESKGVYKIGEGIISGSGRYNAKSVKIKGKSVNNIDGELIYDPNSDSFLSREYTANCGGGKILGNLLLKRKKDKKMSYSIETVFSEIDLHELVASEKKTDKGNDYTKGHISGYFGATGTFGDDKSRIGRLNMKISGMEFAERTLLGKIITASQLEDPTDYIFSDITAESYMKNNMLFLDEVLISGKSMQMKGTGTINMTDGRVAMKFNAFGKKTGLRPSVADTFAMILSYAVVEVKVGGTLDKPEIERTVLPIFTKPFGIFGTKEKGKEKLKE